MRIQIHEYKVEPFLRANRRESKIFGPESFYSIDLGCADQRAIKTIGPPVIAAAKKLAGAAAFRRWSSAMPADIVETAELPIRSAHDKQRFAHKISREVVAGIRHLIVTSIGLSAAFKGLGGLPSGCGG